MNQLGERAQAVQELEDSLRAQLHETLAEAGSHLLEKPAEVSGADLAAIREREADVTGQMARVEEALDRIAAVEERTAALRERSAAINAELKDLSENMDPVFEEIGRIAFDVYRSNPLVDQEYADIFGALVEVNGELTGIDASIADQEKILEEKPFLEKMVVRGRIALLRNKRTTREGSFRRLVRAAGKDIMRTAFVDEIGDPDLTTASEPFRERLKNTRDREAELERIAEERAALSAELEQLGAGKRPHKRVEELQADMVTLAQTRAAIRADLARAARGTAAAQLPAKCKPLFTQARKIEKRIDALTQVKARIAAGIQAQRLSSSTEQLKSEIARREARQAELKKEIASLRHDMKENEEALAGAVETRGPLEELLDPDLLNNL